MKKKRKSKKGRERSKRYTKPQLKLTFKRAVKSAAKALWKHLVELPEKEREQNIAALKRMLAKKFKPRTAKKK